MSVVVSPHNAPVDGRDGASEAPLLAVRDLEVLFPHGGGDPIAVVRRVSFDVDHGQRLAVVGESGSGKTVTALALMRFLRVDATVRGQVLLNGRDILKLAPREMTGVRGREIAMVFQNPMTSLNPLQTIGAQLVEALRAHGEMGAAAARRRAVELLGEVGISDPASRMGNYPHEFSGGMRQRAMIAMAIAGKPKLLVADEITSALDVTTQARITELLLALVEEYGMALMFITHDLALAAELCSEIQVMYAGRIVERAPTGECFRRPVHPYSEALQESICHLETDVEGPMLAIPGQPPLPARLPAGCAFHPRCPYSQAVCEEDAPPAVSTGRDGGSWAECHFARERLAGQPLTDPRGADPGGGR